SDPTLQSHRFRPAGNTQCCDRRRRFRDDLPRAKHLESRRAAANRIDRVAGLYKAESGRVSGPKPLTTNRKDFRRLAVATLKTARKPPWSATLTTRNPHSVHPIKVPAPGR